MASESAALASGFRGAERPPPTRSRVTRVRPCPSSTAGSPGPPREGGRATGRLVSFRLWESASPTPSEHSPLGQWQAGPDRQQSAGRSAGRPSGGGCGRLGVVRPSVPPGRRRRKRANPPRLEGTSGRGESEFLPKGGNPRPLWSGELPRAESPAREPAGRQARRGGTCRARTPARPPANAPAPPARSGTEPAGRAGRAPGPRCALAEPLSLPPGRGEGGKAAPTRRCFASLSKDSRSGLPGGRAEGSRQRAPTRSRPYCLPGGNVTTLEGRWQPSFEEGTGPPQCAFDTSMESRENCDSHQNIASCRGLPRPTSQVIPR